MVVLLSLSTVELKLFVYWNVLLRIVCMRTLWVTRNMSVCFLQVTPSANSCTMQFEYCSVDGEGVKCIKSYIFGFCFIVCCNMNNCFS